jgi:hypothetical protein
VPARVETAPGHGFARERKQLFSWQRQPYDEAVVSKNPGWFPDLCPLDFGQAAIGSHLAEGLDR